MMHRALVIGFQTGMAGDLFVVTAGDDRGFASVSRQQFQKRLDGGRIEPEAWGELPQDRT